MNSRDNFLPEKSVIGEISRPGNYQMSPTEKKPLDNYSSFQTYILSDVLKQAGGITNDTDLSNINIKRKISFPPYYKQTNVNLLKAITQGDSKNNPFIAGKHLSWVEFST